MRALTRRLNVTLGFLVLTGLTLPLFYAFFHQLYQRGVQAEARLMLSYLHTLQRVYRREEGAFAAFEWYGAPVNGQDFCAQPLEAAQLGFMIHGCHEEEAFPPRYAYRSLIRSQGQELSYELEAVSGSDAAGRSLVCFEAQEQERWVSQKNEDLEPLTSCW